MKALLPILILISGDGSNLQAIIEATRTDLAVAIRAVISNRRDAYGIERAKQAGIPTYIIPHDNYPSRIKFEAVLQKIIDYYHPKLIVLAGFMRKLSEDFVAYFPGRMINIHPSLLPKYAANLNTHECVLATGDREHGVSIHYVTKDIDKGPLICQASLLVTKRDTPKTLSQRIHTLEHILYPQVLSWFSAGRLALRNQQVWLDNKLLPRTGKEIFYVY
ncbi:phosphoribosylglycinamide formyltransferase [Coxiella endosymbiont of Amblyomma nuttalli]|uniref:phosphoribosylglycinamide formyltransferase n=1 Tax=Coxiella endosymbiont of Amblyomma nuttalli TaxID=2749996 RepID=UPI001BAD1CB8|nr:phosphoribosylglycinamide formyltransferase [Coxiella endosymbiont of Amblyomma nuttalli]QTS83721.1 Phosphoribosylglycinamide formyltransferase [Coxiella endosymbiont of Amblyomma nuttalli]